MRSAGRAPRSPRVRAWARPKYRLSYTFLALSALRDGLLAACAFRHHARADARRARVIHL